MFHMHDCFALPCCYAGYFEKTRSKQLMLRDQGNWSAASMLWATVNADPTYRQQISEWIKLAKISHVSIGGGVQVEQLFWT